MRKETERKTKYTNRGAAMMVCVVIIAILMAFVFSLLAVTYTLYASQNKKVASKRNSEAANTISIALEEELTSAGAYQNSDLWKYIRYNVGQEDTWPYYLPNDTTGEHDRNAAFRYFTMNYYHTDDYFANPEDTLKGYPGNVSVCIYWMLPEDVNPSTVDLSTMNKNGLRLFVEVICDTGSQSYVVTNEYKLKEDGYTNASADMKMKNMLNNILSEPELNATYNPQNLSIEEKKWSWVFEARE